MAVAEARVPVLNAGTVAEKREEIRRYFHATYDIYEQLFAVMGARTRPTTGAPTRRVIL